MKMFGQHVPMPILVLAAAEYGLAALAFALAASLLVGGGLPLASALEGQTVSAVFVFGAAVVLGLTAVGLYQPKQRLRVSGVIVRLIAALVLAVLALAVVNLVFPLDRRVALWALAFALSFGLLGTARLLFEQLVDREAFRRCVLIYGAGERAASLLKLRRRSDQRGFKIAAFLSVPGDKSVIDDERVAERPERLLDYAKANGIDEIVVAMDERRTNLPIKDLLECRVSGIVVMDLLGFLERETGKVNVDLLNPSWLIYSDGFSSKPIQRALSRALDLGVALVLGFCALPVMAIVALAVWLEDRGPVLFRQRRVGVGGRPFTLYKFRSMIKDAESDGAPKWAVKADPRVTRVGQIIRKFRLDELPQLFNVVRGDMSLVGPRPERPEFVQTLSHSIPYYHERHSVKPGITGWAQLRYPYGASDHDALEKLQYDLYYVKHRSVVFDMMVILQTVEVVLWGKGAR